MRTKEVIKEKGFTIEQVALALGKSKSGMSQIVNNDNTPPQTLRKIAEVIGCSMVDFFADECNTSAAPVQGTSAPTCVCPHCGKAISVRLDAVGE